MDNRQGIFTSLVILFFVIVAILIGLAAFWLGQQSPASIAGRSTDPATLIIFTPTPLATDTPALPAIVTNTPTTAPSPTATIGPTDTPTATPTETPSPTSTPIVVVTHINALGRLETTEYAMQTVVDLGNDPENLWEKIVGSDKLMLIAEGEVVAGFDFTKIDSDAINVEGTTVKIVLPAPEILYSRIDNDKTYVYERQTGLLVSPDITLESRARRTAENSLVDWAIERDIFEQAEKDGRLQIENLLRSLGFTDITIEVGDPNL